MEGRDTNEYDNKLVKIIRDAKDECGYNIEVGSRFFCGKLKETNYEKSSPGGIQGNRYVNLKEVLGDFNDEDVEGIARKLREITWK